MVLRRLHSAVGSGPPLLVTESVRSPNLPTLSTHVTMVPLPSYHGVLGVLGLQDSCSCSRSDHAERRNG